MYKLLYEEGKTAQECAQELMNTPPAKREIELQEETGQAAALLAKLQIERRAALDGGV